MKSSLHTGLARRLNKLYAKFTSGRGHEVGLFLMFVCVASGFWLMMTLNNETQQVVEIPLDIVDIPDSVTVLSDIPPVIKVNVHDKGSSLLRSRMVGWKTMKVEWADFDMMDNTFRMGKVDMLGRLRSYFAPSAQIVNVMPDSLRFSYTTVPGRKVPVRVDTDLMPDIGFTINGPITITPDSVMLYGTDGVPEGIGYVMATPAVRSGLRDTTHLSLRVTPPQGIKTIPDHLTLTVPVEPLIVRKQMVRIEARNVPDGHGLLTFPAVVEVSYLIPMSAYKTDSPILTVVVDYADAVAATGGMIPVKMPFVPDKYRNISLVPDSVEYILEDKH